METEKSCKIGFAITGSFCTHEKIKEIIQDMVDDGMDIIPIFSENVQTIDSRFGKAEVFTEQIEEMTGHTGIRSIQAAEPDRTERKSGCNGHCTLYRKYNGKVMRRYHRYACFDGSQGTS